MVILTGAGRGFCAGGDVKGMAAGSDTSGNGKKMKAAFKMPMEGGIWQLRTNMYSSELLRNMGKVMCRPWQNRPSLMRCHECCQPDAFVVRIHRSICALSPFVRHHLPSARAVSQVTIAAINGACAGAGFSWACASDMSETFVTHSSSHAHVTSSPVRSRPDQLNVAAK